jgi:hypothetical protein
MCASRHAAKVDLCLAERPADAEELPGYESHLAWLGYPVERGEDRAVRDPRRTLMDAVDGNAIGGLLIDVFGTRPAFGEQPGFADSPGCRTSTQETTRKERTCRTKSPCPWARRTTDPRPLRSLPTPLLRPGDPFPELTLTVPGVASSAG